MPGFNHTVSLPLWYKLEQGHFLARSCSHGPRWRSRFSPLQLIGHIFCSGRAVTQGANGVTIVCATSLRIPALPHRGVSRAGQRRCVYPLPPIGGCPTVQRRQMTTPSEATFTRWRWTGDFDDCQRASEGYVQRSRLRDGVQTGRGSNSINWGPRAGADSLLLYRRRLAMGGVGPQSQLLPC